MIINRAGSKTACALVVMQGPNKVFQMVVASRSRLNFISRSVGSCYEMTSIIRAERSSSDLAFVQQGDKSVSALIVLLETKIENTHLSGLLSISAQLYIKDEGKYVQLCLNKKGPQLSHLTIEKHNGASFMPQIHQLA